MDKIHIKDLEIFAKHGVFPEENVLGQKFLVSAVLYTETRSAGKTDDLTRSIHYGEVSHMIKAFMEEHTFKLLETVAERLAEKMLLEVPRLQKIRLEIKKPWAPVGLPLDTVSVEIERGWHTACIALGSNMGDREGYLHMGVEELTHTPGCQVERVSAWIETAPYGGVEQDDFLNGCLVMRTLLSPKELLDCLHRIEQMANRIREVHWGPRTLDLDIIFYDDLVMSTPALQIPHIEMHKRDFVLIPLNEIAPYYMHPVMRRTVGQMLEELR